MKRTKLALVTAACAVAACQVANASLTTISGSSSDGNTPGTLVDVMHTLIGPTYDASVAANRVDDGSDQVWIAKSGGVISTLIMEIAGNRGGNEFGLYDLNNKLAFQPVFTGPNSAVMSVAVTPNWSQFGFYLKGGGGTFYSRMSDNGGNDNMLTLKTSQAYTFDPSPVANWGGTMAQNVTWNPGEYLLGWEDLPIGGGAEPDYQDMLVKVDAMPVPEPTTVLAGALLLLPFGASTIRGLRRKA